MRPSNIEEYKKKPNQTLAPEHYIDTAQPGRKKRFSCFSVPMLGIRQVVRSSLAFFLTATNWTAISVRWKVKES